MQDVDDREQRREVGDRLVLGNVVVDAQAAAHVDETELAAQFFEVLDDDVDLVAHVLEDMQLADLRTDVQMHADDPLLIEEAIDHYIAKSDIKGLIVLGIFALILNIIFIILVKVRMYGMSVISNKILLNIRQDLYEHIQTLSFSFFDSRPTGKILARIIGDVNSLKDVLTNMVTTLIPEFITVIGVVVIMVIKDWRLALASLSTIPIMVAGIIFVQNMSHKRWQIFRKKSSNLNAYVHEDIAGMNVVQSFGAEDETKETFENLTNEQRQSFVDAVIYADMFGPVIDFCWGIGSMMLYLVGIRFLGFEKVSVGLLVAFGSYINMFWNPIMNLSNFYNNLITNLTAAERIFDILDTKPDIVDGEDVDELPEVKGEVTFSHVGFTYDRGTPAETKVLEDVNFVVKPGETIALVGPTGAGKTTIVNLISRFYDIEQGKILIDGYDLTKVSMNSLRRQMGVMTQDNFIFQGTVKDNILYGKLDATVYLFRCRRESTMPVPGFQEKQMTFKHLEKF